MMCSLPGDTTTLNPLTPLSTATTKQTHQIQNINLVISHKKNVEAKLLILKQRRQQRQVASSKKYFLFTNLITNKSTSNVGELDPKTVSPHTAAINLSYNLHF